MPRTEPFQFAFQSPDEAVAALLGEITPVGIELVALDRAAGRVLAQGVASDRPSPPADVSAMDGFAVRLGDLALPELPIAGEVRIGREPPVLPAGACLRVVTGGAIPPGAELVVKREDTREHDGQLVIAPAVKPKLRAGDFVRRTGENLAAGVGVVEAGKILGPSVAAALATFGVGTVLVHERVRVAIVTTGDELVSFGDPTPPTRWQIRDSNSIALTTLLASLPSVECEHRHVRDDQGTMNEAVAEALARSDALLLTGGVSMGHRDFVADALAANGVRTVFHGVPQRPGKPILGGITQDGRPVLALPGNPVSVMVTARRIGVPAILARAGVRGGVIPAAVRLDNVDGKAIDLWWHRPVKLDVTRPGHAQLVDPKSSGDVAGAARSDGFVEMPPGEMGSGPWPFYSWAV